MTYRIRDDLVALLEPRWLQVITEWTVRGGVSSRILATHGDIPSVWARG